MDLGPYLGDKVVPAVLFCKVETGRGFRFSWALGRGDPEGPLLGILGNSHRGRQIGKATNARRSGDYGNSAGARVDELQLGTRPVSKGEDQIVHSFQEVGEVVIGHVVMEMPATLSAKRLPEADRTGTDKMKFTKGGELRPEGFLKVEDGISGNLKV